MELEMQEFEAALDGFTPAALQNVNLHQAGEQGWEAVGGLREVKDILLETLMLPSQVIVSNLISVKVASLSHACHLFALSGNPNYHFPSTYKTCVFD